MDRIQRVKQIVDDYQRRRSNGEAIDKDQLLSTHESLMPELGAQFQKLGLIKRARAFAESTSLGLDAGTSGPALDFSPPPDPPPDSFPGYKITRRISRGGQGVVYLAIQETTGREVAIKVMREGPFAGPSDHARFQREVDILAALDHPHIVTIRESGISLGHHFLVMDFIDGRSLDVYIASHELSVREKLQLFLEVCDAVHAAHLRGVVHRDLKPSNIRVDRDGKPHVLDFGLAKLSPDAGGDAVETMTATGQFIGSLPWAAPEQAAGNREQIDLRTDVYSLGVILFQMLTGRFPYAVTGSMSNVIDKILHESPPRPSSIHEGIDDEVETVVLKCLSKEPERRYQNAGDLARDVERYLRGEPLEARRDSTWYVLRKNMRRYRVPLSIAAAFVLLVTASAVAMFVMYGRATREAATASRVQASLQNMLSELGSGASSPDVTVRHVLDSGAQRAIAELDGEPRAQVELIETVASTYQSLGSHEQALAWWRRVLTLHRDVLRDDDRVQGMDHYRLANTLEWTGYYVEAETSYQTALRLLRKSGPGARKDLVEVLTQYGGSLQNKGDYDRARPVFLEALALVNVPDAPGSWVRARTLMCYGGLLHDTSDYDGAERYYRDSLAIMRRLPDPKPLIIAGATELLGLLSKDEGDYRAAETLIREALMIRRQVVGEGHVRIAQSHLSMAKLYIDIGDWTRAENASRNALDLYLKVFGSQHRHTARPMTLLGRVLVEQRRFTEAEPVLRRALEIRRHRKPPGHWKTAKTESILGACLTGLGRLDEAERLLLDSLPIISADRGERHRRTVEALQRVIELYDARGERDKADLHRERLSASIRASKRL